MKKVVVLFTLVIQIVFVSGCATLADARAAKGTGKVAVYDNEYEEVWGSTIEIIKSSSLDLVSNNKEDGLILAQAGMSALSYGENVAIFIEKIDGKIKTRVEVVNKRALATNIAAPDWEFRIIRDLNKKLKGS